MASRNLTERVEVLEMNVRLLEDLPARMSAVEAQILQLRTEMRGEFSAVRSEMRTLGEEIRAEMRMLHEEVLDRIATIGERGRRSVRKPRR
jgi:vacuolar-type H+-ATPase subunit H